MPRANNPIAANPLRGLWQTSAPLTAVGLLMLAAGVFLGVATEMVIAYGGG